MQSMGTGAGMAYFCRPELITTVSLLLTTVSQTGKLFPDLL